MEKRKHSKTLFAVVVVLFVLFSLILSAINGAGITAFAESAEYTSVLEDLQKDETFKVGDYPASISDNSLQVIQIAEGTGKELLIYVYQPSAVARELTATHISIATDKDNLQPQMYTLKLLDRQGVFAKYLVDGLTVKQDDLRVYEIISIFRAWNAEIDAPAAEGSGNTINEVSYGVAQLWSANTVEGGEVLYHCEATEVIAVTGKLCGYLRYGFIGEQTDAWYVAFTTDKPIEELLEADVYYVSEDYISGESKEHFYELYPDGGGLGIVYIPSVYDTAKEHVETVNFTDKGTNIVENPNLPDKWKDKHHCWAQYKTHVFDRIQTVEEFKNGEKLTSGTIDRLEGLSWVLRFVETPYAGGTYDAIYKNVDMYGYHWEKVTEMGTKVSSVSVMRLKFRTAGRTYNLGVVDNMQTSSRKPSGGEYFGNKGGLPWWAYVIIAICILMIISPIVAILATVFPFVKTLLKFILKGIGYIFKALWWLVCLPFKGIAALVRKIKKE